MLTDEETEAVGTLYLRYHPDVTLGWLTLPEAEQVAEYVRERVRDAGGWAEAQQEALKRAPMATVSTNRQADVVRAREGLKVDREPADFGATLSGLVDEVSKRLP